MQIQPKILKLDKMTKGDKKNKNIKVLDDVRIHNHWYNIFRRKFKMHDYFSESAFGSQSDTKVLYRNLWEDEQYLIKKQQQIEKDRLKKEKKKMQKQKKALIKKGKSKKVKTDTPTQTQEEKND